MKRPTKEQVAAEILDLKALKPVGPFSAKTARTISAQVEELEHGIDVTSDEYDELSDEIQMAVMDAQNWKEGQLEEKPSTTYKGLVA